uniref:DUF4211 domain-containing protein n=1 Tax=Mycena chlorophos TaxID=658473 RepID=A0ABQ0LY49_MYCCL|nr:predicted protein [Mycena chlorophos]
MIPSIPLELLPMSPHRPASKRRIIRDSDSEGEPSPKRRRVQSPIQEDEAVAADPVASAHEDPVGRPEDLFRSDSEDEKSGNTEIQPIKDGSSTPGTDDRISEGELADLKRDSSSPEPSKPSRAQRRGANIKKYRLERKGRRKSGGGAAAQSAAADPEPVKEEAPEGTDEDEGVVEASGPFQDSLEDFIVHDSQSDPHAHESQSSSAGNDADADSGSETDVPPGPEFKEPLEHFIRGIVKLEFKALASPEDLEESSSSKTADGDPDELSESSEAKTASSSESQAEAEDEDPDSDELSDFKRAKTILEKLINTYAEDLLAPRWIAPFVFTLDQRPRMEGPRPSSAYSTLRFDCAVCFVPGKHTCKFGTTMYVLSTSRGFYDPDTYEDIEELKTYNEYSNRTAPDEEKTRTEMPKILYHPGFRLVVGQRCAERAADYHHARHRLYTIARRVRDEIASILKSLPEINEEGMFEELKNPEDNLLEDILDDLKNDLKHWETASSPYKSER